MNHDPERWAVLGRAIRGDRERQGLTREQLAERVLERGGQVSGRSIGSLEAGVTPKKRAKPPTLEPTVAALGWRRGWTDRILAGEDPETVLSGDQAAPPREVTPQQRVLELVPGVYEFGRLAVQAGASPADRDTFEAAVQRLLAPVTAGRPAQGGYALASYRPHAPGEGVPADDAERIYGAMERGA
ncbi:hypothetical protein [Streptomyces bobili]|uniref:hypothetical protein n=1 Tax=Streptomyces bobili TaxID=67280 RepID=UPI000A36BBA5|nr:hypothetical protein [Streptomyces bobili]